MTQRPEAEFERLLTLHKDQLFAFIFCIVQNVPDAEDVFQQTCIVLWEKFAAFEPDSDFIAWASQVARYKGMQLIKKKHRDRHYFSDEFVAELAERESDRQQLHEQRSRALRKCSKKLSDRDRTLLGLCYRANVSIKKTAEQIGRPVGSVYDSLSRIRGALRKCIERETAEEDRDE